MWLGKVGVGSYENMSVPYEYMGDVEESPRIRIWVKNRQHLLVCYGRKLY